MENKSQYNSNNSLWKNLEIPPKKKKNPTRARWKLDPSIIQLIHFEKIWKFQNKKNFNQGQMEIRPLYNAVNSLWENLKIPK